MPYFFTKDHVRFDLYQTNGSAPYNWLFIPGGPGGDSSYLKPLIDLVTLPGNVWLVDLPGNGTNTLDQPIDYNTWLTLFPKLFSLFKNPICVGHSFGGMIPLLYPELEKTLKGLMILSSCPSLWLEEAASYAKQFAVPDLTEEMQAFIQNPCQETFDQALAACTPYYFPKQTLEKGKKLVQEMNFTYQPAVWWQKKALELNFNAQWIPKTVPTFIVNSKFDCICPYTLYAKDDRFIRPNIQRVFIEDAGHFIWVENPKRTIEIFNEFIKNL